MQRHVRFHTAGSPSKPRRKPRHTPNSNLAGLGNLGVQHRLKRRAESDYRTSQPGDAHERQADHIAHQALNRERVPSGMDGSTAQVTHSGAGGVFNDRGRPLPEASRRFFESRFNRDLGHVRIHDDAVTHGIAERMNARAFTQHNHIGFSQGQFNPKSEQGRQLLAHEISHVTQASDGSDTIYRETWDIDDSAGTVERGILVQLIFEDTYADHLLGTGWDTARKNTFRSGFESAIETTFNNSGLVLNPPASAADVLPPAVIASGYKPLVDICLVPDGEFSVSEDWEVEVSSNPRSQARTSSSNRSYGTLDEADNTPVAKRSSAPGVQQVPSVHEFGHFIGLDHPGYGIDEDERNPAGGSEYSHSGTDEHGNAVNGPTDLMGGGMALRPFYFNEWAEAVDEHIAQLRRERTLEELERSIDEFFRGDREMGDFPVPSGPTQYG